MKYKYECEICGHIASSIEAPENCQKCGAEISGYSLEEEYDNYYMMPDTEPWGVCGYGIIVANIVYSRKKLSKYFEDRTVYESDPYEIGQVLEEIAREKGYQDMLCSIDSGPHAIFFYPFSDAMNLDMFYTKQVQEALLEVLSEVSNEPKEKLLNRFGVVGIGGTE